MRKVEIPLLILGSSILLSYVIGLNLWQSAVVIVFSGAVYFTGRRIKSGT